jgi:hypothetical protein
MTTQKEAFMKACEDVYDDLPKIKGLSHNLTVHLDPSNTGKARPCVMIYAGCFPEGKKVYYDPPRVAPPEGTPVLVWCSDKPKTSAVLAISLGMLQRCGSASDGRPIETLKVKRADGGRETNYANWSVLVEEHCRGGM